MPKSQEKLKQQIHKLPGSPGVYKFVGKKGEILYIGKATSLKSRVKSYFTSDIEEKRSPLIAKMVGAALSVKFEKTESVLEALLLESKLIKKFSPIYNTADKDQKSFNYVIITEEKFPRVLIMREREITPLASLTLREGPKYIFGPFPHGTELKEALKIVRKIFPFRDRCIPFDFPSPISRRGMRGEVQGCFNYQIGLCPGVCVSAIDEKEYGKIIRHIKIFFEGNKKKLVTDLVKEMKSLAKNREFEKAAKIKKKIFALKHIQEVALIKDEKFKMLSTKSETFRIEAYDIAHISGTHMVGAMMVLENGEIKKSDYRMFKIKGQKEVSDTKALKEILERRFKHPEWRLPDLVVVDGGVAQLNVAETQIKSFGLKISVVAVTKDEKHRAKKILGVEKLKIENLENQILLANSESHRFALKFHRQLRDSVIKVIISK